MSFKIQRILHKGEIFSWPLSPPRSNAIPPKYISVICEFCLARQGCVVWITVVPVSSSTAELVELNYLPNLIQRFDSGSVLVSCFCWTILMRIEIKPRLHRCYFISLCEWSRKLPPSFQPIRSMKTWNNRDLVICIFSLQEVFAGCTSCPHFLSDDDDDINLCSDRSLRIAGFCLFDTQWKLLYSVSTNLIANSILFYNKCC